ncbi:MAG: hypothetical protein ACTS44_01395 [Candidatus Hodgkinia cicadicola]
MNNIYRVINVLNSRKRSEESKDCIKFTMLTLLNQTEDAPLVGKFRRLAPPSQLTLRVCKVNLRYNSTKQRKLFRLMLNRFA